MKYTIQNKVNSSVRVLLTIAALLCSLVTVQATDYYLYQGYNDDPGGWSSKGKMTSEGSNNYSKIITVPANTNQLFVGVAIGSESCGSFTSSALASGTTQNAVSGVHGGVEIRSNDRCSQGTSRYFILIKSPVPAKMKITYNSSSRLYTVAAYTVTYSVTASLTGTATLSPNVGVAQTVNSGDNITFTASNMPTGHKITGANFDGTGTASYTDNTATVTGVGSDGTLSITVACGGSVAPTVTTGTSGSETTTTATISSNNISSAGLTSSCATASITAGGVQYGTTSGSLNQTKDCSRTATGTFDASLTDLTANTTYYYRAYATNSAGLTAYGEELSFTTAASEQYVVRGSSTNVFGGSAWDKREDNKLVYSDGFYSKTFYGVYDTPLEFKVAKWSDGSYPTQTYVSTTPTALEGLVTATQTDNKTILTAAACGTKTGSTKCSTYDVTIKYDASASKVYVICVPSLYYKGPLVTGSWGSYTRFSSVTKNASGNWVFSTSFSASSGGDSDAGKIAVCTGNKDGYDGVSATVKLPEKEEYTSTYGLIGCEIVSHTSSGDTHYNYKTQVGTSGTLYLTVTRYAVEDYRVVLSTSAIGSEAQVYLGATPAQNRLTGHLAKRGCSDITDWGFYYSTTSGITQQQVLADFSGDKNYILEAEEPSSPAIGDEFTVDNPAFKNISNQTVYVVAYVKNGYDLSISDELALVYCGQSFTLSGVGSVSGNTSYPWEATTVTASNATGAVSYVWSVYSYDAQADLPLSSDTELEYNYVFEPTATAHQYIFKGPYDSTGGKTNKYIMRVTASDGTCEATRDYTFSIIAGPDVICN